MCLYYYMLYFDRIAFYMTIVVTPLSGSEKLRFRKFFTFVWASGLVPGYCNYVFVRFSSPYGHREMYPPKPKLVHMSL